MNQAFQLSEVSLDPVSLMVGFGAGAAIAALIFGLKIAATSRENAILSARLESERDGLGDHFKALAQLALQSNNEQFLTLAGERLKAAQERGANDLDKRTLEIEKMVKPVEKNLEKMNSIVEQLQGTDKAIRQDLQNLHKETSKLTTALRNPAAQGKWGEFVLEAILERANLIRGTHYETQTGIEGGGRPDVIINLHDGFKIAIDSKAPINDFIARLDDNLSGEETQSIKTNMARTVRGHVKALGARSYQENIAGSDFVILFLPSEAVFSATLASDPSIVDFAAENNVVIASPTLIISLLRVVGLSWKQVKMAENAVEVAALGADLHKRFAKFLEHFSKIGKSLGTAVDSYDDALGSMNRMVMPAARKFTKLHSNNQNSALADVLPLEKTPKSLSFSDDSGVDGDDFSGNKISHG